MGKQGINDNGIWEQRYIVSGKGETEKNLGRKRNSELLLLFFVVVVVIFLKIIMGIILCIKWNTYKNQMLFSGFLLCTRKCLIVLYIHVQFDTINLKFQLAGATFIQLMYSFEVNIRIC